uniref:consOR2 n=1 Tax=synthetic construct TaxID=32630 RepID=UPI003753E857
DYKDDDDASIDMEENQTSSTDFILLGLFDHPRLELLLFVLILLIYLLALLGNGLIILLIHLDSRLHTPMYFFLSQLSLMDLCYTSTTVPKMLVNLLSGDKTISFAGCGAQLFLYLTLGGTECLLLAVMAYDRYVAICHPLRYPVLMNPRVCLLLAAGSWLLGSLDSLIHTVLTLSLPFCGSREINHFFCEVPALLKLACADTSLNETVMFVCCVLMLLIPLSLILVSYGRILLAVLRMQSAEGRRKAFSTCSSHLTVVGLFYGAAIYMYLQPKSYHSPEQDKVVSLFYTILTPMLNPLIYSLRNKEVKGALRRVLGKCRSL